MPEKMDNERGGLNDRLKDFQANPDENLWASLEEQLAKKRKRRPVVIWWFAGAAVFLALLLGTPLVIHQFREKPGTEMATQKKENSSLQTEQQPESNKQSSENQFDGSKSEENRQQKKWEENETETTRVNEANAGDSEPIAENSKTKKERKPTLDKAISQFGRASEPELKTKKTEGESRKRNRKKLSEFTSKLLATLPEIPKRPTENQFSPNQNQTDIQVNKNEMSGLIADNQNPASEKEIQKAETAANHSQPGVPIQADSVNESASAQKPEHDSDKNPEPKKVELSENSVPEKDSVKNEKKQNWTRSLWLAPKFATFRSIAINQNPGENRISLPDNKTQWTNRLAIDLGFRLERNLNSWIGVHGFLGLSYLQDRLSFYREKALHAYDLQADNGTLSINPKVEKSEGSIQSSLFAGIGGAGIALSPSKSTTIRFTVGSQFRISETISKEMGGKNQTEKKSASLTDPIYFIQTSVSRQFPIGKHQMELEPMFQYYSSPVFRLQPGTSSQPVYLGLQLHLIW